MDLFSVLADLESEGNDKFGPSVLLLGYKLLVQ